MSPFAAGAVGWLFPGVRSPAALLQFGLSIVGIAVELAMLAVLAYRGRTEPAESQGEPAFAKGTFWLIVAAAAVTVTALGLLMHRFPHYRYTLFVIPVAPISGAVAGLLAASALHAVCLRVKKRAAAKTR